MLKTTLLLNIFVETFSPEFFDEKLENSIFILYIWAI